MHGARCDGKGTGGGPQIGDASHLAPTGTEQGSVRRAQAVTLGILEVCAAAIAVTAIASYRRAREKRRYQEASDRAVQYRVEQPYLEPPEEMGPFLGGVTEAQEQTPAETSPESFPSPQTRGHQQSELERLRARVVAAEPVRPLLRWGLLWDNLSPVTLVTHRFLHQDWVHLFVNVLFLFPVGTFLENVGHESLWGAFNCSPGSSLR